MLKDLKISSALSAWGVGGGNYQAARGGPRHIIYATVRLTGFQIQGFEALRLMETTKHVT